MAHIRRPLALAVALNTAACAAELGAGLGAGSVSLLMDGVHNLSDELALVCLFLAYLTTIHVGRSLQRAANLLNSVGLVAISGVLVWQALDRLLHPRPMVGWLPIAAGLLAAAANWGVARVLRPWGPYNATIRLAYLHNLGDTYVSLAPIAAGLLVSLARRPFFDPLVAIGMGVWIVTSTLRKLRRSVGDLIWPEQARCPHGEPATLATATFVDDR